MMARDAEEETSPLLGRLDSTTYSEPTIDYFPLSANEHSDTRIFMAIAFSWLASFLAALGKMS